MQEDNDTPNPEPSNIEATKPIPNLIHLNYILEQVRCNLGRHGVKESTKP